MGPLSDFASVEGPLSRRGVRGQPLSRLHVDHSLSGPFNFRATLTGTTLQAVGVGMFASTAAPPPFTTHDPTVMLPRALRTGPERPDCFGSDVCDLTIVGKLPHEAMTRRSKNPDQVVDLLAAFFESGSW